MPTSLSACRMPLAILLVILMRAMFDADAVESSDSVNVEEALAIFAENNDATYTVLDTFANVLADDGLSPL